LSGEDAAPLRHQVWELPEIKPQVVEYQRHRLACACCGETTCASLPPGVPAGQSGPRLVAFAGLLMAYFRQSKRRTALFLETLLNQPCCPALTLKMQAQVTQALRPAYEELASTLPAQPHLGIDESPDAAGAGASGAPSASALPAPALPNRSAPAIASSSRLVAAPAAPAVGRRHRRKSLKRWSKRRP
jgi:hypothetical protein